MGRLAPATDGDVIDWQPISSMHRTVVKRLLHLALLIGAVMGLVGQGTAVASTRPCPEMMEFQAANDDACAIMAMPKAPGIPEAKHIPSGCDAMVGCTTSAMIEPALLIAPRLSIEQSVVIWPSPHKPNDRSIAPEQEPPASLL